MYGEVGWITERVGDIRRGRVDFGGLDDVWRDRIRLDCEICFILF